MNNKVVIQIIGLIVLAGLAWFLLPYVKKSEPAAVNVTDFASCEAAGGILTDGDPVVCHYNNQTYAESEEVEPEVMLDTPKYGALVTSPLNVQGKARGNWFFEANIPVVLKDDTGKVLVQQGFQASSDWMTTDFVPFFGTLTFDPGDAQYGVLIISKDNPSGETRFDASYAIPVRFK